MKKLVIIFFLSVNICSQILGTSVGSELCLKIQPNGDSIYVYWQADEYSEYYTDLKKNVVDKNEEGYWVNVKNFLYTKMRLC